MRIAVTYEDGQVFQHFGHTAYFKLYDVEDGRIVKTTVLPTGTSGHGALAGLLAQAKAGAVICGGIGGGAQKALLEAGILLYPGVSGNADEAAQALAEGRLTYSAGATCDHHSHHHDGGDCGTCGHGEEGRDCHHGNCNG